MVLGQARMQRCLRVVSPIEKFKRPIRTVQCVLHIEISLQTKFYIFSNFFTIFFRFLKIVVIGGSKTIWIKNFVKSEKNSKKIQKNVKFGLQRDFNTENILDGSDRPLELQKLRNDRD